MLVEKNEIQVGHDEPIILDKMFGPTVFASLKITASLEDGGWKIERMVYDKWTRWCTIPAQLDQDEGPIET